MAATAAGDFFGGVQGILEATVHDVALADLSGDGRVHLVSLGVVEGQTKIFLHGGRGDGRFSVPVGSSSSHVVSSSMTRILTANVGGGDDPEIVVAGGNGVGVLSLSSFSAGPIYRTYTTPDTAIADIAAGDFDGDQDVDLVVYDSTARSIRMVFNQGAGGLVASGSVTHTFDAYDRLIAADVDRDGDIDVTAWSKTGSRLAVYKNSGNGLLTQFDKKTFSPNVTDIDAADMDGDGDVDLVVGYGGGGRFEVLRNSGTGAFSHVVIYAGSFPATNRQVGLADVDQDNDIDVVLSSDKYVEVLRNSGSATFGPGPQPVPLGGDATHFELADVDGNGSPDVVAVHDRPGDVPSTVTSLANNGLGDFAFATMRSPFPDGGTAVAVGDYNRDGQADIAKLLPNADPRIGNVAVVTSMDPSQLPMQGGFVAGEYAVDLIAADIDNDQDLDLVTVHSTSEVAKVFQNNGAGRFTAGGTYSIGMFGTRIVAGDLNGDGLVDLIAGSSSGASVSVLLNAGGGAFAPAVAYAAGAGVTHLAAVDLDGDGDRDLALATGTSQLRTLINDGAGAFGASAAMMLPAGSAPVELAVGDVAGNGRPDLVGANGTLNSVTIIPLVTGLTPGLIAAGQRVDHVTLADLDNDGDLDIVAANADADSVSILARSGPSSFATERRFAVGDGPRGVAAGDFSGDGFADIVTVNSADSTVLMNYAGRNLPNWVSVGSPATWDATTKTLSIAGPTAILHDPGPASRPIITASGASAVVQITSWTEPLFHASAIALTNGATARFSSMINTRRTLVSGALSIDAGSTLDLRYNDLILRGGSLAAIQALVTRGFGNGSWTGDGLRSSAAAASTSGLTTLGYADNADLGLTEFGGITGLTGDEILVRYTYYGDADLSGVVDLDDFNLFLAAYQSPSALAPSWLTGDFDFSGTIDLDDFNLFLAAYQATAN